MASVCLYFQLHQPYRLRRYSVFDTQPTYFDRQRDAKVLDQIAQSSYLPASRLLLKLIKKHDGLFRLAFSLSGSIVEQFREHCPEMIALLKEMAQTGCVEFIGETYYHSLTFLYSRDEFKAQIKLHEKLMGDLFGQTPHVFRNTELIYNNELAAYLHSLGHYRGILTEGADQILGPRSPNYLYHPPGLPDISLLLKNPGLTDDITLRFSNKRWADYPLTAEKFARWVNQINGDGYTCNLFMEYGTLGHYQASETGIFDFISDLPGEVFKAGDNDFKTPSQCVGAHPPVDEHDVPHMISWADTENDLSPWLGNAMQSNALHELYKLEPVVKGAGDDVLLEDWRRLTASDHFYYMSTKYFADGDAHQFFNPYESPYDAYINFMNVLDNLRTRVETPAKAVK